MIIKRFFCLASCALFSMQSYGFFCPNNFNQIDYGNTIDQVTQQCGKPDKTVEREVMSEGPQEWNYFIPQTVANTSMQQVQGTLKTQVTFDANGKAINISVNGIGVGSTTVCGPALNLGATRDEVKAACGDPSFINKQTPDNSPTAVKPAATKVSELTYNSNPPATLVFENGILKEKK